VWGTLSLSILKSIFAQQFPLWQKHG